MSGTPHAVKLVKRLPNDDFDGKFALIWWSPKDEKFYVATKQSDMISEYAIFTTDGVAERVYMDANSDSAYNATEVAVTAYFTQFSNTLYMSFDASCETGSTRFFGGTDTVGFGLGYADTTDLYTITKIWKS